MCTLASRARDSRREQAMLARILVPLDGSSLAERALPYVRWLARTGAELLLLRAVARSRSVLWADGPVIQAVGVPELADWDDAETALATRARRLQGQGLRVGTCVQEGNPAQVILEQARPR